MIIFRKSDVERDNCTEASIYEFPDILTDTRTRYDHVAIGIFTSIYLFLAMAIVCDEFFVPAIERLCYKWNIPYNIAGATFMAAGTSSPEFFVNVVATFITEGDIGVGAIVGSSVFNSLGVSACCGLTGVTMSLDWWPLTRDITWYFISAIVLTIVVLDNVVVWYESLILVSIYIYYVIFLCFDDSLQKLLRNKTSCTLPCFVPTGDVADFHSNMEKNEEGNDTNSHKDVEPPYHLLQYPKEVNCMNQFMYLVSWPIQFIYFITIPNCRYYFFRNWYLLSIICAIFWISILSYLVTWMLTVVGHNLNIPDTVMGITLLAICTSIPEIVSSVIVTRKGYGSMAVCNAVGSNTFNLVLCLGIPWLIRGSQRPVDLISLGLTYQCLSMIITGILLYITFLSTRFTLRCKVGVLCLIMYSTYIVFAVSAEMNVFGVMNLPTCIEN